MVTELADDRYDVTLGFRQTRTFALCAPHIETLLQAQPAIPDLASIEVKGRAVDLDTCFLCEQQEERERRRDMSRSNEWPI